MLRGLRTFGAERAGFEPAVGVYPHAALAKRSAESEYAEKSSTSSLLAVSGAAPGAADAAFPPDLAAVVAAWGTLTDPIKLAVLALEQSASGGAGAR